jgi:DNA polymerase-4
LPSVVDSRASLHEAGLALIRSVYPPAKGIRLVGVTLSNFQTPPDRRAGELDLIDLPLEAAEP